MNIIQETQRRLVQQGTDLIPRIITASFNIQDGTRHNSMMPRIAVNPISGVIVSIYRLGYDHAGNNDNGIIIRRSFDNGASWGYVGGTAISYVVNNADQDNRNPGAFYTPTGRLILIYGVYISAVWYASKIMYSDNDGDTWSTAETITHGVSIANVLPAVQPYSNRCFSDADGNIYYPWYLSFTPSHGVNTYLAKSEDNGVTWDWDYKLIFDGWTETKSIAETVAFQIDYNNWGLVGRGLSADTNGNYTPVILLSKDGGLTWGYDGADSMLFSQIGLDINSDFMYLDYPLQKMANTSSPDDACTPDAIVCNINGIPCVMLIYFLRNNGVVIDQLKINIITTADLITYGLKAKVKSIGQVIFDSTVDLKEGGNESSIFSGGKLVIENGETLVANPGGTGIVNQFKLNRAYLLDLYRKYVNYVDPDSLIPATLYDAAKSALYCDFSRPANIVMDTNSLVEIAWDNTLLKAEGSDINAGFDMSNTTQWPAAANVTGRAANGFTTSAAGGIYRNLLTANKVYKITNAANTTGAIEVYNSNGTNTVLLSAINTTVTKLVAYIRLYMRHNNAGTSTLSALTVKEITGNHLGQPTLASRPLYRNYAIKGDGTDDRLMSVIGTNAQQFYIVAKKSTDTVFKLYRSLTGLGEYTSGTGTLRILSNNALSEFYNAEVKAVIARNVATEETEITNYLLSNFSVQLA